ncbi:YrrS family protein [Sporosarcina sp. ACRSL]|uniref:YrrS family protein n=1 Tax=Sporosarcina sp. ACRSL TaxID=2918215 RepID=UPI001EF43CCD|nr:YrrS family protein [Sporosarcina sp. ACRSL]MCG7345062.1 YrrS family protein [Sporosarcina sp. ACRSL]
MKGNDPRYSRVNRKKMRNRSNQLLNIMIGLVVLLIIIVGASIITGNNDKDEKGSSSEIQDIEESGSIDSKSGKDENESDRSNDGNSSTEVANDEGEEEEEEEEQSSNGNEESGGSDSNDENADDDEEEQDSVIIVPDNDDIIIETVINPAWKPIGTVQTGAHESKYDVNHVDWNEKKKAIAYATGHSEEGLIYWKIKNGGSPQKSIGIVSTRDKSEKYRVYLEWVDGEGWKPVQMDILNTLDFDY